MIDRAFRLVFKPLLRLNPAARLALLSHFLWWVGELVGDSFVSVYTYRLTESFAEASWFQLWRNFAVPFGFLLGAWFARRTSGAAAYRLGVGGYAAFYGLVLLLGEGVLKFMLPLGLLWGLAMGLYWLGWQLLVLDLTKDEERDGLLSLVNLSISIAGFGGPWIAGAYLASTGGLEGYGPLFTVVAILFMLAALVTLPLKTKPLHGAGAVKRLMKIRWKPEWKASMWTFFFQGFHAVMVLFVGPLLAYVTFGNEKGTGAYGSSTALVGLCVAYLASHWLRRDRRKRSMAFSAVGLSLASLLLLGELNYWILLSYGIAAAALRPFYGPPFFATQQRLVMDSPRLASRRADWLAIRDFPIMAGRVFANLIVIFFITDTSKGALIPLVVVLFLTPLLTYWFLSPYIDQKTEVVHDAEKPGVPESA